MEENFEMSSSVSTCAFCYSPATKRCSGCYSVFYCGILHQRKDWLYHQKVCKPYKVEVSLEHHRRFVVATRNIKKGDQVLSESPLIVGPCHLESACDLCPGCLCRVSTEEKCPSCKWPVCSVKCPGLKDHHGAECALLTAIESRSVGFLFEALLPLRCLLLQKTDPNKWKVIQTMAEEVDVNAKFFDRQNESRIYLEEAILKPLAQVAPALLPPDCTANTIRRIFSLLGACRVILFVPWAGHAEALCAVSSLMDHSCLPNTNLYVESSSDEGQNQLHSRHIIVKAAKDIQKGERLTYTFVSVLLETRSRQDILYLSRGIICECARCTDPKELETNFGTVKCGACGGWILPGAPDIEKNGWECDGVCGQHFSAEFMDKYLSECSRELDKVQAREEETTKQEIEETLSRLESRLHPHHSYCTNIRVRLVKKDFLGKSTLYSLNDADLEQYAELCRKVLDVLFKPHMCNPSHSHVADCLRLLGIVELEMMKRRLASGVYEYEAQAEGLKNHALNMILVSKHMYNNGGWYDGFVNKAAGNVDDKVIQDFRSQFLKEIEEVCTSIKHQTKN